MAEKKDFYELLDIPRTASDNQIKLAYTTFTIKNHPDKAKTPEAKANAKAIMQLAIEAKEVLLDPIRRKIYDTKGHQGLEDHANGKQRTDFTTGATTSVTPRAEHKGEALDFFQNLKKEREGGGTTTPTSTGGGSRTRERTSFEERRKRFRQNSETQDNQQTPQKEEAVETSKPVSGIFNDVADTVSKTADKMQHAAENGVVIPAEDIIEMKKALQKFSKVIDDAIARSRPKNNNGLKF